MAATEVVELWLGRFVLLLCMCFVCAFHLQYLSFVFRFWLNDKRLTVWPRVPSPTVNPDWLGPDRAPASCRKALARLSSTRLSARNHVYTGGLFDDSGAIIFLSFLMPGDHRARFERLNFVERSDPLVACLRV